MHGTLHDKIGAAFSTAANIGGGAETTVLDILKALLIHGMLVKGTALGSHYGPISIAETKELNVNQIKDYCKQLAMVSKQYFNNRK